MTATTEDRCAPIRDPLFRDPSGFVLRDGLLLRQVNAAFAADWDDLVASGMLAMLQDRGLLIGHDPAPIELAAEPTIAHALIRPEPIDFISYPQQWSFGMLRRRPRHARGPGAAAQGFTLRDATAYNVQRSAMVGRS